MTTLTTVRRRGRSRFIGPLVVIGFATILAGTGGTAVPIATSGELAVPSPATAAALVTSDELVTSREPVSSPVSALAMTATVPTRQTATGGSSLSDSTGVATAGNTPGRRSEAAGTFWAADPRPRGDVVSVIDADLPDPSLHRFGDTWWLYATGSDGHAVQAWRSDDLVTWQFSGDVALELGGWAVADWRFVWAPTVAAVDGGYVLYVSVTEAESGQMCIAAGSARRPQGPYQFSQSSALVCQNQLGGSIDPAVLDASDGRRYLLWKHDGNAPGGTMTTGIWIQPLSDDGLQLRDRPVQLVRSDRASEFAVVEGPSMIAVGDRYLLVYSLGDWQASDYAIAAVWCSSPTGPCTAAQERLPELSFGEGPGGPSLAMATTSAGADGEMLLTHHLWDSALRYPEGSRVAVIRSVDPVAAFPLAPATR